MDNLTGPEIVQLISTLGASGALAYFVKMLAGKKLAWWYQIDERDTRIRELIDEKQLMKEEYEARCKKWEDLYFDSKQLAKAAAEVTQTAVTVARASKGV